MVVAEIHLKISIINVAHKKDRPLLYIQFSIYFQHKMLVRINRFTVK